MAQRRELHDAYFRKAKAEGYVARSAYKLRQINDRKRLIRPRDRVLDLGCAPGSWLQVASELVGPDGVVAGLDLKPIAPPPGGMPPNVRAAEGDIFAAGATDLLAIGGIGTGGDAHDGYDVVLSDMAPSTGGGGGGSADHFRSVELCRRILALLPGILRPGGNLAMKVFEGEAYPELHRETAALFTEARGFKPDASRDVSREIYIVAKGYRPPAGVAADPDRREGIAPPPPPVSKGWSR